MGGHESFTEFTTSYRETSLETAVITISQFNRPLKEMKDDIITLNNNLMFNQALNWGNDALEQLVVGLENTATQLNILCNDFQEDFNCLITHYQSEWVFLRQILRGQAMDDSFERNQELESNQVGSWRCIHRKLANFIEC